VKPVILLIGGVTGTGKSTVATEVAHRLGINRVTCTDVVRQTMRAFFDEQEMPSIHRSSFEASPGEPLLSAFLEQCKQVLIAVEAAVERAIYEGWSTVVEGVHVVPGLLTVPAGDATVVECVLAIDDLETHANHFWIRDAASGGERPVKKYLDRIDDIRLLQQYVVERARESGVPVFESSKVDETVGAVIDLVLGSRRLETV
jgi:2-phosphoglycerate kinase